MQTFARIDPAFPGVVAEIFSIPDGASLSTYFTPVVVAQFVACPANVQQHWTYDGVTFSPPPPPPVVNPVPTPQQLAQAIYADSAPTAFFLRGLVIALAAQFGKTPQQVLTAIINAAN